jgi:5-methylthioadenosine/S-adenosylhomocysteine deaminase
MNKDDFYYFSLLSMVEELKNGVTTVNDMYFETDQIIKAAHACGIDGVYSTTLMNPGDSSDPQTEILAQKRIDNLIKLFKDYPNEHKSICIHGLYTTTPEYCMKCAQLAKELKCNLIHMHFCEYDEEYKAIQKNHNVVHPSECLIKYFKGFDLVLAHCVELDEQAFKDISELKASVAINPISNFRLGCGFADIKKMREHSINISLGTDGQGSGSNLSIMQSARQVA